MEYVTNPSVSKEYELFHVSSVSEKNEFSNFKKVKQRITSTLHFIYNLCHYNNVDFTLH